MRGKQEKTKAKTKRTRGEKGNNGEIISTNDNMCGKGIYGYHVNFELFIFTYTSIYFLRILFSFTLLLQLLMLLFWWSISCVCIHVVDALSLDNIFFFLKFIRICIIIARH